MTRHATKHQAFFRSLRWQLARRYAVLTCAALLMPSLLFVALLGVWVMSYSNLQTNTRLLAQQLAVNAQAQLAQAAVDWHSAWYDPHLTDGLRFSIGIQGVSSVDIVYQPDIWVLDSNMQLRFQSPTLSSQGAQITAQQWHSATIAGQLAGQTTHDGYQLWAEPVTAPDGRSLGWVLVGLDTRPQWGALLQGMAWVLGLSLLCLVPPFLGLGVLFGVWAARPVTRRFARLVQATDAWQHGDFSHMVQDAHRDELSELTTKLNQMANQLAELLAARQQLAVLEERNRLARDLHDSVKQQLFAIQMQLSTADLQLADQPEKARQNVVTASKLTEHACSELTQLISELHPVGLQDKPFVTAVRDLLTNWQQQTQIVATLQVQHEATLPLAQQRVIFRILQEALANVAKHSQATQITVLLTWQPTNFCCELNDNGCGFAAELPNAGFGLRSMRERAQHAGGQFHIRSTATGTHIRVLLPINH